MSTAELVRYKNGALADPATGRIVQMSLSSERAREMQARRVEQYRRSAEAGLVEAGRNTVGGSPTRWQAWANVNRNLAELAMTGKGKESVMAAQFVAKSIDAFPDRRQSGSEPGGGSVADMLGRAIADRLLELARRDGYEAE